MKKKSISAPEIAILYKNNLVENIYEACSCCYDNTKAISYLEKKEYVKKRVDAGHESILEHGRMAFIFANLPRKLDANIIEAIGLPYTKWLEFYTVETEYGNYNVIVNGSVRAYKCLFNNVTPDVYDRNQIIRYIISCIMVHSVKELYGENNHGLTFNDFVDVEPDVTDTSDIEEKRDGLRYSSVGDTIVRGIETTGEFNEKAVFLGIDDAIHIDHVFGNIYETIRNAGFDEEIYENIIPVAVLFKNMSRTATHQLVRHRNAITQESQRYVDSSNATFTIPIPIENFGEEKEYNIKLFGNNTKTTLIDLATELTKVYEQLKKQGLKKEEARAFLPSNINCKRLYMTFTISSIRAFLKLRTDPHAQLEIRKYAEAVRDILKFYILFI